MRNIRSDRLTSLAIKVGKTPLENLVLRQQGQNRKTAEHPLLKQMHNKHEMVAPCRGFLPESTTMRHDHAVCKGQNIRPVAVNRPKHDESGVDPSLGLGGGEHGKTV